MTTATALPAIAAGTALPPATTDTADSAVRPVVRPARPGEEDALARALADAFADDALMLWAFPDPGHRARVLPAFFRVQVEQCLAHGGALAVHRATGGDAGNDAGNGATDGEPLGALLFLPPGRWEDPGPRDGAATAALAEAIDSAGHGEPARRLAAITRLQTLRHPRHRSHHYLAFVGVHPDARGTRAGQALLHAFLAEVDSAGQAAYAETSSPAGARLLASGGFTRFGGALALPGGGPRLAPVWRGPR
ncbi:N-acetyltransferase [Kitasatospora xanthocidica]|uniref:N-acetyltransferase n=1 Tax=Kitasatospora xanthocidica TaxID=83382 RepID=A0A372ZNF7_9ACTN|nr:GNAT family N-acetyltransferase [Kitasatospora xanthocidica]RGD56777.1 N-acetyltransferase [Kitasatospora xanthocidica]